MKIPKHAKPVFQGILFDVFQWKQKLYDGTYTTFEMIQRKYTTDVIATIGKKIVVLKQSQPGRNNFYGLPGGRVEKGESTLKGAKRELLEETGMKSKNWQKFKAWNEASKIDYEESTYIARDCIINSLPNIDGGEKITMQLVSFNEFIHMIRQENFIISMGFKIFIYECFLDKKLKQEFKYFVFGK